MVHERRLQGERRLSLRPDPDRRALEGALGRPGLLRERIKEFVHKCGPASVHYFDRAVREWYGPLDGRAALLDACRDDATLEEAWSIVHAAGAQSAPLVPYIVRRYFGETFIDERV